MGVSLGLLGFLSCILCDFNRIHGKYRLGSLLFPLGALLILAGTIGSLLTEGLLTLTWTPGRILLAAGAVLSLGALIYALFFALPFGDTYTRAGNLPVVTRGIYGLCRHPGFWPFAACYAFLAALLGTWNMAVCGILFSFANFLYIVLQDRYIFPAYIGGYGDYKKQVPFLIPTIQSFRNAFPGLFQGGEST